MNNEIVIDVDVKIDFAALAGWQREQVEALMAGVALIIAAKQPPRKDSRE